MDLNAVLEACAGKTAEEIEAELMASVHADKILDPGALASQLASMVGSESTE